MHPHGAVRQVAALVVLFGTMALIYFVGELIMSADTAITGLHIVGASFLAVYGFWLCIGLGTGYWPFANAETDRMVTELMQWRKANGSSPRDDQQA